MLHRLVVRIKSVNILQKITWQIADPWFLLVTIFLDFGLRNSNLLNLVRPIGHLSLFTFLHPGAIVCPHSTWPLVADTQCF